MSAGEGGGHETRHTEDTGSETQFPPAQASDQWEGRRKKKKSFINIDSRAGSLPPYLYNYRSYYTNTAALDNW